VRELAADDVLRHTLHCRGNVGEQPPLLRVVEEAEQITRLRVIIVAVAMVEAVGVSIRPDFVLPE
jgi:hypothetical protein